MIFGTYPCCAGELVLSLPENAPGFLREECPHCGKPVWHWLSRLDPESLTEEDFLMKYDVDHATKRITLKSNGVTA